MHTVLKVRLHHSRAEQDNPCPCPGGNAGPGAPRHLAALPQTFLQHDFDRGSAQADDTTAA